MAGIHLAVAVPLVLWQESRDWHKSHAEVRPQAGAVFRFVAWQEGDTVVFDPCNGGYVDVWWTPQQRVVQFANPVAIALSGWAQPCPASWTVAKVLRRIFPKDEWKVEIRVAAALCLLVFLQWLLVGGLPLIRPRRWWLEPGALITISTLAAFFLVLIPSTSEMTPFPMLFAALAWLLWFGLLVWKAHSAGWRLAVRGVARNR